MAISTQPKLNTVNVEVATKELKAAEDQINNVIKQISGLGIFDIIETLFNWSQDEYPDEGFWSHINEVFSLLSKYNCIITLSTFKFEGETPEFTIEGMVDTFLRVVKLVKNIITTIIINFVKGVLLMLKTMYDTLFLTLKAFAAIGQDYASLIRAAIDAIGNAVRFIYDLFTSKKEEEPEKNLIDIFIDNVSNWVSGLKDKYSLSNIRDMLCNFATGVWGAFTKAFEPYINAIKNLDETIKSYLKTLGSEAERALREAVEAFKDKFLGPIEELLKQIIAMILNSITSYSVMYDKGLYYFNFTSDVIKDKKGVFVFVTSIVNPYTEIAILNYEVDGVKYSSKKEGLFFNILYENNDVKLNVSIPGFLNNKNLKSKRKYYGSTIPTYSIVLESDFLDDFYKIIEEYIKYAGREIELFILKMENAIQEMANSVLSTFLPHNFYKVGVSGIKSPLSGYRLYKPNISVSHKTMPKIKSIDIVNSDDFLENKKVSATYKLSWDPKLRLGYFLKEGDKITFSIPDDESLTLYYFKSIGTNNLLLTEEQYNLFKNLKEIFKIPLYIFNTAALTIFGSLYLATVQIQAILKTVSSIPEILPLKFNDVLEMFNATGNSFDDEFFFDALESVFPIPEWKEWPENPFAGFNYNIIPPELFSFDKQVELVQLGTIPEMAVPNIQMPSVPNIDVPEVPSVPEVPIKPDIPNIP